MASSSVSVGDTSETLVTIRDGIRDSKALPKDQRWRKMCSLFKNVFSGVDKFDMSLEGIMDLLEDDKSHLFELLIFCLKCSSNSNITVVLAMLTEFMERGHMTGMVLSETAAAKSQLTPSQEHLIQLIVKLPDIVANRIHGLDPGYSPKVYTSKVMGSIVEVLSAVKSGKTRVHSLMFVSNLIGRLSVGGHVNTVVRCYIAQASKGESSWVELSTDVLKQLPEDSVDSVLTQLIMQTPPSLTKENCLLWKLLGGTAIDRETFCHCLLHKNLLVRTYRNLVPLYNIAGYLLSSDEGQRAMTSALQTLVAVWCDPSSIRHTPVHQHLYISQAIVLFTTCCVERVHHFSSQNILPLLLGGVGEHLNSTIAVIRAIGQIVAECVVTKLNEHGDQLKFEDIPCESDEGIQELRSLSKPLKEQEESLQKEDLTHSSTTKASDKGFLHSPPQVPSYSGPVRVTEESDSDDEFIPYAMPEEVDTKGPNYLRQCIQDLIQHKNVEKFEVALKKVEGLVRRNPLELKEVAVELMRVLVHLSDDYAIDGFHDYRSNTMIAIATRCPHEVAEYLTGQVYSDNYSLRQRMDMLETLTLSAAELSSVSAPDVRVQKKKEKLSEAAKKLEEKTRRFPSAKRVEGQPNRFAPVAGYFFFPLVNGFSKSPSHVQKDTMFLTKLLFSLGLIAHAANGLLVAEKVAKNLLEFVLQFAEDSERSVKEGVLFCCQMAVSCLPETVEAHELSQLMDRIYQLLHNERAELEEGLRARIGLRL